MAAVRHFGMNPKHRTAACHDVRATVNASVSEITCQEYYKAVCKAVNLINGHLHETIYLSQLAKSIHISGFHFHRIFKALTGESPGEYIRRLRLEKAAFRLHTSCMTVLEIAEQTGYQTPQALSKAFRKHFGVSPSVFRQLPSVLNTPETPSASQDIVPEIRTVEDREVIVRRIIHTHENICAYTDAWQQLIHFMNVNGVPDGKNEYIYLMQDMPFITRPEYIRSYVCISNGQNHKPSGMFSRRIIPGGLYAVFTNRGSCNMPEKLYGRIYREWIPHNGYEVRDIYTFEKFLNAPCPASESEIHTEIYVPVSVRTARHSISRRVHSFNENSGEQGLK
jgi:AraC family transcriptional regulator